MTRRLAGLPGGQGSGPALLHSGREKQCNGRASFRSSALPSFPGVTGESGDAVGCGAGSAPSACLDPPVEPEGDGVEGVSG